MKQEKSNDLQWIDLKVHNFLKRPA